MLNGEVRTFRGSVVRSRFQNGLPWGRLDVSRASCSMTSGLGRNFHFARDAARAVRCERVRLPFVYRTVITFLGENGRPLGPSFIPWRARRLHAELLRAGWTVEPVVLNLRGRRPDEHPPPITSPDR